MIFRHQYPFALAVLLGVASNSWADKLVLVAGGGTTRDGGPATAAAIGQPFGMARDKDGNLFIADYSDHRVWKVDSKGIISVAAGTGKKGFSGDGGPAIQGQFDGMHDLVVAPNGDLFVADSYNLRVRKIDAKTRTLSTVAGDGQKKIAGDGGPGEKASLDGVASLWLTGDKLYMTGFSAAVRVLDLLDEIDFPLVVQHKPQRRGLGVRPFADHDGLLRGRDGGEGEGGNDGTHSDVRRHLMLRGEGRSETGTWLVVYGSIFSTRLLRLSPI